MGDSLRRFLLRIILLVKDKTLFASHHRALFLIRKKAEIQQIAWHPDVAVTFPKSVLPGGSIDIDSPYLWKYSV